MTDPAPLTVSDLLEQTRLRVLAGPRTFERGLEYARNGRVGTITATADGIRAIVRGTQRYAATLGIVDGDLAGTCECPMGVENVFCKHIVALGIARLDAQEPRAAHQPLASRSGAAIPPPATPAEPSVTIEEAGAYLRSIERDELVTILLAEADRDDGVRRRLLRTTATGLADGGTAKAIRRAIDQAVRFRDHVGYREIWDYTQGIQGVIDRIELLLGAGAAETVIDLSEYVLHRVEDVVGVVDDSDGELGGILERLQELHLAACRAASPDPVELAGRLFRWELGGEWDAFHGAAATYADVLGPRGHAEYRRLADAVWATVPPIGHDGGNDNTAIVDLDPEVEAPDEEDRWSSQRYAITSIMRTLAGMEGDVDGLISVLARDLSRAYHYLEVAQVCLDAGRLDEAVAWAERGLRAFPDRTDTRLRTFLADRYASLGRHDDAIALAWADFTDQPNRERYRNLEAYAAAGAAWPTWRNRALDHVRSMIPERMPESAATGPGRPGIPRASAPRGDWFAPKDGSVLVDLLLADREFDEAWRVAQEHGCRRGLWLDLARTREANHPADAVPIYRREVEADIESKRNDGYRAAADLVGRIAELMSAAGQSSELPAYLAGLRTRHGRKRNFIALLDAATRSHDRSAGGTGF